MRTLPQRFVTIDGLRGIAALGVVVYHMVGPMERGTGEWLPAWLTAIFARGFLGVEVFFVISGFVIAHSVRGADHTPRFLGRFALRRALRLDPPYWMTIAAEIALVHVGLMLMPSLGTPTPTTPQVLTHLIYAQNLTGQGDILPVFWTLCYEVQFYVFFVGTLVTWRSLKLRIPARFHPAIASGFLTTLGLLSIAVRYAPGMPDLPGLALDRWFQFFLGALTYWCIIGACSALWLGAAWTIVLGYALSPWAPWEAGVAVYVSAFLLGVAASGGLGSALGSRWLQYLGKRSYSLYLIHLPIAARAVNVFWLVLPAEVPALVDWAVFAAGIAASIAAAEVLWMLVEGPSMAWSKRVRLPKREPAPATRVRSLPEMS